MPADLDEAYFKKVPWCAKLMEDPEFVPMSTLSRQPKPSTEDSLLAESLSTEHTINAWLSSCKKPHTQASVTKEVRMLIRLGSGLNGYPHICHSGVVGMLMDEAMGILLSVNKSKRNSGHGCVSGEHHVSESCSYSAGRAGYGKLSGDSREEILS